MTPVKKSALRTLLFYLVAFPFCLYEQHADPGGPCVPGMGFLLFFLLVLISFFGLAISFASRLRGNRARMGAVIVHLIFFALIVVDGWIGRF